MGQEEYSTKEKEWEQINYEKRLRIEALYRAGIKKVAIAEQVGYSERTVRRELTRGMVKQVDTHYRFYESYSADVGQQRHDENATAKGVAIKLGSDYGFAEEAARLIRAGRSPYGALEIMRQSGKLTTNICERTLYNYIEKGYIPGITQKNLPEGDKERKREYNRVRTALNNTKGRSISERAESVGRREEFGHWEFDTVSGKQGTKTALLVLSERKTRQERIRLLKEKTQEEVKRAINEIELELGTENFKSIYKTMTSDNGSEFLNMNELEESIAGGKRTTIYYCHPYSAWERGTNENINKMIRRFIPKGKDIGSYTKEEIQEIEGFINSTPRKVLEGYPSNTLYQQHTTA